MGNLLKTGMAWLGTQLNVHASSQVTYYRGASSVSLLATVGESTVEVEDGRGGRLSYEIRDYLILAANLILGGVVTLPKPGDYIREVGGGTTFVYEVLAPVMMDSASGRQTCYKFSDPHRTFLRVHTKLKDRE